MSKLCVAAITSVGLGIALGLSSPLPVQAQGNFEIQVYGSETVPKDHTMVELHTNYTVVGSTAPSKGVWPTQGQFHNTLEITHGFTDWFETGFYIFTSQRWDQGLSYVGSHIRPRVAVPEAWKWPVGASLSVEVGYQSARFSQDRWSAEVRPIIDKKLGPWYLAFNPTFDLALSGPDAHRGPMFSPNAKASYDLTKEVALGLEYYGVLGPPFAWQPSAQQQHILAPSVDLNLAEDLEVNFGVGFGLTGQTDHLIPKLILGRRFNW